MSALRWKTDRWLWAIAAAGLFIALGFVDPLAGKTKGEHDLWSYFALLDGEHDTAGVLVVIMVRSLFQAVPALLLGWLIQAVAVVCGLRLSGGWKNSAGAPKDAPRSE